MSIERLSQVADTRASYWKVRVQILEDFLPGRSVRCCERGDGLSISLGALFYVACIICRVGGPFSGYCTKSEPSGSDNDNGNYNNVPCLKRRGNSLPVERQGSD